MLSRLILFGLVMVLVAYSASAAAPTITISEPGESLQCTSEPTFSFTVDDEDPSLQCTIFLDDQAIYSGAIDTGTQFSHQIELETGFYEDFNQVIHTSNPNHEYEIHELASSGTGLFAGGSWKSGLPQSWIFRLDEDGAVLWDSSWVTSGGSEYVNVVKELADNNALTGGYYQGGSCGGSNKKPILQVIEAGTGDVEHNYDPGNAKCGYMIHSALELADNKILVVGSVEAGGMVQNLWIAKFDSSLSLEWNQLHNFPSNIYPVEIIQGSDGFIVATSTSLLKLDDAGNIIDDAVFGTLAQDVIESVVMTRDGGYMFAGSTSSFGPSIKDVWVVKVDSGFNIEWTRIFGGSSSDMASSLIRTEEDYYVVAGTTSSFGWGQDNFDPCSPDGDDVWVIAVNEEGDELYTRTHNTWKDKGYSIAQTSDGKLAFGGAIKYGSFSSSNPASWIHKFSDPCHSWHVECTDSEALTTDTGSDYFCIDNSDCNCVLSSAHISSDCAGGSSSACEQGETIFLEASFQGECDFPLNITVNARSGDYECVLPGNYPAPIGDIGGMRFTCDNKDCLAEWKIPVLPDDECEGKTIHAGFAQPSIAYSCSEAPGVDATGEFFLHENTPQSIELIQPADDALLENMNNIVFEYIPHSTQDTVNCKAMITNYQIDRASSIPKDIPYSFSKTLSERFPDWEMRVGGIGKIKAIEMRGSDFYALGEYGIAKLDERGNTVWYIDDFPDAHLEDIVMNEDTIFILGNKEDGCGFSNPCYTLYMYDLDGQHISTIGPGDDKEAKSIALSSQDKLIVSGDNNFKKAWIATFDLAGNKLWEEIFIHPGSADSSFSDIIIASSGNIVMAGTAELLGKDHVLIAEFEESGNTLNNLWSEDFMASGLAKARGHSLVEVDAGFVVVGQHEDQGLYDGLVVLFDQSGNYDWHRLIGDAEDDCLFSALSFGNTFIVTGYSDLNSPINPVGDQIMVAEFGTNGNVLWQDDFGGDQDERAYVIIEGEEDEFLIGGANLNGPNLLVHFGKIPSACYDWYVRCYSLTNFDSPTWRFCVDNLNYELCAHTCGNGILEPGEECDPPEYGAITSCADIDGFVSGNIGCTPDCVLDTTGCETPYGLNPGICGDGIINSGETCDSGNMGPIDYCINIMGYDYTSGDLECVPPSQPNECHINTCDCSKGTFSTTMNCGDVYFDDGSDPPLNTIACNDNIAPPVTILCENQDDCVYAIEGHLPGAGTDAFCAEDGEGILNANNELIYCNGLVQGSFENVWCPRDFAYDPVTSQCSFTGDPTCDQGRADVEPREAWCNGSISGWMDNYESRYECARPQDSNYPVPPDDAFPKKWTCCHNFSITQYETLPNIISYGFYREQYALVY